MRVWAEGGKSFVACAPCDYRSKPFDTVAKANGAAKQHVTGAEHRRRARLASLRRAA
jgi:hypothetical protein